MTNLNGKAPNTASNNHYNKRKKTKASNLGEPKQVKLLASVISVVGIENSYFELLFEYTLQLDVNVIFYTDLTFFFFFLIFV